MTLEEEVNLSHIFRQPDLSLNVDRGNHHGQNEQAPTLKASSLRPAATPFVANNPYALKLDEII